MIQAADTYLHIAIKAINFVQTQPQAFAARPYGISLAPECLQGRTHGNFGNPNFWGCGAHCFGQILDAVDFTEVKAMFSGTSRDHDVSLPHVLEMESVDM